ncbi:MAG: site-specific integrase, partial [Pseudomonadota bacterium]
VIDSTPQDRMLILVGGNGQPMTGPRTASNAITRYRRKAGLSADLRLQDCRGTAATMLLNADLSLSEIANHMGWSVRYAAQVIEHYARVSPDQTDAVLVKLAQAKRGR